MLDFIFVEGQAAASSGAPTLAVLYRDATEHIHIRTYEIAIRDKVLVAGPWSLADVDPSAVLLAPVPLPLGGMLVISADSVLYVGDRGQKGEAVSLGSGNPPIRCWGAIDGTRFLVADAAGGVTLVALLTEGAVDRRVTRLTAERLGDTSLARVISYLDGGLVFVGSALGNSALVRLQPVRDAVTGSFLAPIASYASLGPIIDLAVVDLERQGQCQVIAACGGYKEGSLRIVRSGISIEEQAVVELPGLRGIWALSDASDPAHHKFLVLGYATDTRVLAIEGDEMAETDELSVGFTVDGTAPTLYAANLASNGALLQVTAREARVVRSDKGLASVWRVPVNTENADVREQRITVATSFGDDVVLAISGGDVVWLHLNATTLVLEVCTTTRMTHEVASLHLAMLRIPSAALTPADASTSGADSMDLDSSVSGGLAAAPHRLIAAVGLWSNTAVHLMQLDAKSTATEIAVVRLGDEVPLRSVLLAVLEGVPYLLAALGDGTLYRFRVVAGLSGGGGAAALVDRKRIVLGTRPVSLSVFSHDGAPHVFAACDRPTVLFSQSGKVLPSSVNLQQVSFAVPFNSAAFPDALALVSETALTIGTVGDIRKLDVRTIPLGDPPRRVSHVRSARAVVVAVDSAHAAEGDARSDAAPIESTILRAFDDLTFEPRGVFELDPRETCTALCACSLLDTSCGASTEFLVVGTSYIIDDEEEPSHGRVLLLALAGASGSTAVRTAASRSAFRLVAQREVRGGVMSLVSFAGGKLAAGINSKVQVYSLGTAQSGAAATATAASKANAGALQSSERDDLVLVPECGYAGFTLALFLDAAPNSDFLFVGDLMKSLTQLRYNPAGPALEEIAASSGSAWMTAVGMLDDNAAMGADGSFNLFTSVRDATAESEEDRGHLALAAEFHLGDMINVFRPGSLVMLPSAAENAEPAITQQTRASMDDDDAINNSSSSRMAASKRPRVEHVTASGTSLMVGTRVGSEASPRPLLIFGTVSGALGVVISLPPSMYNYLSALQVAMATVVTGVGGLSHRTWRSSAYRHETLAWPSATEKESYGAIDGDFLELFLELDRAGQEAVIAALNASESTARHVDDTAGGLATVDEAVRTIDDLSRLH